MSRNLRARQFRVGATFTAIVVVLGVGSVVLEKKVTAFSVATRQAPKFEVDPMWPKPLPNHWVMGNVIGVSVDAQDHIWIIHRQGSLEAMEDYTASPNPPKGANKRQNGVVESECCTPAPPVLEFDEAGNLLHKLGRPGRRRLRVAGFESRNHRRLQGQRVDRRQWPRRRPRGGAGRAAARQGGAGRGASGRIAAPRARRVRLLSRQHGHEVHAGWKIPDADRQGRRRARAATIPRTWACRPRLSSIRRPTNCTSPTATATSA